jgi:putative transposase
MSSLREVDGLIRASAFANIYSVTVMPIILSIVGLLAGLLLAVLVLRNWLAGVGTQTAYIMPGSPWENGYCESFNSKLRNELLDGEIFYTLREAQVIIEQWRWHYNRIRPHSALGYRPPAPETTVVRLMMSVRNAQTRTAA